MSTYLITGAGGYLAGKVIDFLKGWEGCEKIIGVDIKEKPSVDEIIWHRIDIRDRKVTGIIAEEKPQVVIHLAYVVDFLRGTKEESSINIGGLERVLDGVRDAGCRQLIVASSTVVYGAYPQARTFQEEDGLLCIHPYLPYSRDKVIVEDLCKRFAHDHPETKVCIIRPAIVVGPHWGNFWVAAFFILPFLPRIDGQDPLLQFIHEDDLSQIFRLCIEKEAEGIFNACADGAIRVSEVAEILGKKTLFVHSQVAKASLWLVHHLRLLPIGSPPGFVDFFAYPWVASNRKAKEVLGFKPEFSSREAFEEVAKMRRLLLTNLGGKSKGSYRIFNALLNLELWKLSRKGL